MFIRFFLGKLIKNASALPNCGPYLTMRSLNVDASAKVITADDSKHLRKKIRRVEIDEKEFEDSKKCRNVS